MSNDLYSNELVEKSSFEHIAAKIPQASSDQNPVTFDVIG